MRAPVSLLGHVPLACLLLALAACHREPAVSVPNEPRVLTTFYPLTYFAQRIAGERVAVSCPLPEGADPIHWLPGRAEVAAYQSATLVLSNGASFEKWLDKVSLPSSRVVNTALALQDKLLKFATTTHSHGPGGAHTHEGVDGHTWLDPLHAKVQAKAIEQALARAFPQHTAAFAQGLAALERDLDALHARAQEVTGSLGKRPLLASHPAYNYLAARCGWQIVNLDLDPSVDLPEAARQELHKHTGAGSPPVLLWERAPTAATSAALAQLGVRSVLFSPAENPSPAELAAGDYLAIMRANFERLAAAVR